MSDLRNTQLTIPMEQNSKEIKEFVKQHWNITFARQKKVSIYAKRIMSTVLAMIRESEEEFLPYYQFHINDIATEGGDSTNIYKYVKTAFDELTDLKWLIEDPNSKKFQYKHLLNTDNNYCGYNNGIITIVLSSTLKEYFIAMAHYSTYELKHYMTFKSWYSMRLFELLSAFRDTGKWVVSIEEYRELMDCKKKYLLSKDLIKRTLTEPLEELEKTNCAFEYREIYNTNHIGRGRKPVSALEFTLKKVKLKEIPASWYAFSDDHKRVLTSLKEKFKITEPNIIAYAPIIGINGAKKLLREWEIKEASNKRIDDKVKYCNAVWVRVGKEAKKSQEATL